MGNQNEHFRHIFYIITLKKIKWLQKQIENYGFVFDYDNTRPHTSLVTCQKLVERGWGVLPHSSYSPDLAPTDYYLVFSIQNSLTGKNFIKIIPFC